MEWRRGRGRSVAKARQLPEIARKWLDTGVALRREQSRVESIMNARTALADAFASAPFVEDGWDTALRGLASATGSWSGQLLAAGDLHLNLNWATDLDADYVADFMAIEGHRADVNWRIGANGKPFELIYERHYDAVRAVATDETYLAHVRRFDAEHGAQILLTDRPGGFFGLAALHSAKDGRTTRAQRAQLMAAAPHALAAIRTQIALEHQGARLLRGSLEAMQVAAFLLDARGRCCAMTARAEELAGSSALRVTGGRLALSHPLHDRALQERIGRALRGEPAAANDLWIEVRGRSVLVEVHALPRADWAFGFAPAAVASFRLPLAPDAADGPRLAAALGLTAAEAEIVAALAQGQSRAAIAAARGTSAQTVNSQLRGIFLKCGVQREAELVARAAGILAAR
jgi:DNA-binding CsgD family transcriptional regulator